MNVTNDVVRYRPESLVADELRERKVLRSSIRILDGFIGGFESSRLALLHGSDGFLFDFVYMLCTRAVLDLSSSVVYVDGGNRMDPYVISGLCKRFRADGGAVLSRIHVARAFTAYQMVAIIDEQLEGTINELGAEVVVASCLPTLFYDDDLRPPEARSMYRRCLERLRELTTGHDMVTIITDYGRRAHEGRRPYFQKLMRPNADKVVRFEPHGRALRVWDETRYSYVDYRPVPWNQTVLDDFL